MMETTKHFYEAYQEARTRLQLVLNTLKETDLSKKLALCPNSVGFHAIIIPPQKKKKIRQLIEV